MMVKMKENKIKSGYHTKHIYYLSLVFLLLMSATSFAIPFSESTKQIFTFNESDIVHIKFIDTISSQEYPLSNHVFGFAKSSNVSNFNAYDFNTSEALNYTFIITPGNSSNIITVNFPKPYLNYTFVLEFDYKNPYNAVFYWSWGNATYPIELKYIFRLPDNNEITQASKHYETITENNSLLFVAEGTAHAKEYFDFQFNFGKIIPPNIFINKVLSKTSIIEGETVIVTIDVTNIGGSKAKDLRIIDKYPGIFNRESGSNEWSGDLEAGQTEKLEYTLKAKASEKNKNLDGTIAVYTDIWNLSRYTNVSNNVIVSIEKAPAKLNLIVTEVSIPDELFPLLLYNFFVGYGILMWLFILKRTDHKTWKDIPFFDKIIYSFSVGIINLGFAAIIFVLLALFIPKLLLSTGIEYFFVLVTVYPTVIIIDKLITSIKNKDVALYYNLTVLVILALILTVLLIAK